MWSEVVTTTDGTKIDNLMYSDIDNLFFRAYANRINEA